VAANHDQVIFAEGCYELVNGNGMSVCLGNSVNNAAVGYGHGTDVDLHPVTLYLAVACMIRR